MSDIELSKQHHMTAKDVRKAMEASLSEMESYGIFCTWAERQRDEEVETGTFSGRGVHGRVDIDRSRVAIAFRLPLLLRPLLPKIRSEMEKRLEILA